MMKGWGLTAYAVSCLIFIYGPVLILVVFSFNDGTFATFPMARFTTRHYVEMLDQGPVITALTNSLRIAVAVTLLTTAIAFPAAIAITRYRFPGKAAILSMTMLPLVVPSIVLAVALLVIMLRFLGIQLSLWTVAAGHLLIALPFSVSVLISRLEGFDRSLEEASRDLGMSAWQTFRKVTLPLAMPGIISSLLLGFIISFDEFVIAFFLAGTESTLPVYLYSQLRFPNKLPGTLALTDTADGRVQVDAGPLGALSGTAAGTPAAAGSAAHLAIRPERLTLSAGTGGGDSRLARKVAEAVCLGDRINYIVTVTGLDRPLRAVMANDSAPPHPVGADVALGWRDSAGLVLAD